METKKRYTIQLDVVTDGQDRHIVSKDGTVLAELTFDPDDSEALGNYLRRVFGSHDELVEALEELLMAAKPVLDTDWRALKFVVDKSEAALLKAKGEQ